MAEHVEQIRPRWVYPVVAAWLVATTVCFALVWRYKARPGEPAAAPAHWPERSAIPHGAELPTLVMFAHPECPCTKASLEELSAVMARVAGKVSASVVLVRPPGVDDGWEDTELRRRAESIPGISVRVDIDGVEAARFGARVSGQVLLYDASGALRFAGGITQARGHIGDNVGSQRLLSLIESHAADAPTSHVFGCELLGEARREP
jgi:hypothetical protein